MKTILLLTALVSWSLLTSAQACFPVALGEDNVFCNYQYCDTAGDPFTFSKGIYRIPYLELTAVHVNQNHITSCPRGTVSFSAHRDYPYEDRFVTAAADGWVRNSYTNIVYDISTNETYYYPNVWMEHPNGEWTYYNVDLDESVPMQTFILAGTILGKEAFNAKDSVHKLTFEVYVPVDTNKLIFYEDDDDGNHYLSHLYKVEQRVPLFCNIAGHIADYQANYTALSCASSCTATLPLLPATYSAGDFKAFIGDESLSTDADFTFEAAASGVIQSGSSITLNPGFHAGYYSTFEARTGDCSGADSRIMASSNATIETANTFSVNPNPASQTATIHWLMNEEAGVKISICDMGKRTLMQVINSEQMKSGPHEQTINVSSLSPGMYLVIFELNGGREIQKLIVQR